MALEGEYPTLDLYKILFVDPEAPHEVIKASYRALSKMYHPDRNQSEEAAAITEKLNLAFEVLGEPNRRKEYDHQRRQKTADDESPLLNTDPDIDFETYLQNLVSSGVISDAEVARIRGEGIEGGIGSLLIDMVGGTISEGLILLSDQVDNATDFLMNSVIARITLYVLIATAFGVILYFIV